MSLGPTLGAPEQGTPTWLGWGGGAEHVLEQKEFTSSLCHGFQVLISPNVGFLIWKWGASYFVSQTLTTVSRTSNDPGAPSESGSSPTIVPASQRRSQASFWLKHSPWWSHLK